MDSEIRAAKPRDRQYKLSDGGGLYLLVHPNGGKYWRLDYRLGSKRRTLAIGVYPDKTLQAAREVRRKARQALANGIDPGIQKKAQKAAESDAETFEVIAREWFGKFSQRWSKGHADKIVRRLERDVFPYLGRRPTKEITAPEVLAVLHRIESRGVLETAHRAKQNAGQVFRYAVATGRAERDPTGDLEGALPPPKKSQFAAITDPKQVGELLRAIDAYGGSPVVKAALQLSPLVFVRPGELRQAEWSEIDLEAAQWVIPGSKMKMGFDHIVPLSLQAVQILKELHKLTGRGVYVFPGARSSKRPLSDNGTRTALRALGYGNDEMTPNGFRAMASTLLNEQGWRPGVIERQLAHSEQNRVRAAYHRSEYLEERKKMMQAWADYLDGLKSGADVALTLCQDR
ncbi:tyrosine-type recombinase/integrase [Solemya velesiana gill symbiont]|uniref:Integrase n=1 Tax=Solemya velesiana gill symbiont TaxID=1918948 RepID=A0A1T2KPZ6_9GAMM|nr:integrase arm-type DNA-binding domain-containing protein [Solemya velesiana gill symbiont]OOZ34939.1 integrase [Solemya velesiana gill symbiont]